MSAPRLPLYCTAQKFEELYGRDETNKNLNNFAIQYTCSHCEYKYYTSIKITGQSSNQGEKTAEAVIFHKKTCTTRRQRSKGNFTMNYCPQCGNKLQKELVPITPNSSPPSSPRLKRKRSFGGSRYHNHS
eukprot:528008_1